MRFQSGATRSLRPLAWRCRPDPVPFPDRYNDLRDPRTRVIEVHQQAKGIPVAPDGMWTGLALLDQIVTEEPLQQSGQIELGSETFGHDGHQDRDRRQIPVGVDHL